MIGRILEPEVMDSPDEAKSYDEMDHREVNAAFADDLGALLELGAPGRLRVLDLGTGTALIPIEICQRVEAAELIAADMAHSMLSLARRRVAQADLAGRIALEIADAKALPHPSDGFDVVVSNSLVHHIAEPRRMLAEVARVVRPGGAVLVRDLSRPASEPALEQLVEKHAATANAQQRELLAASLRAALTLEEVRAMVVALGFSEASVQATSDRHWTWACATAPDGGWPEAIARCR